MLGLRAPILASSLGKIGDLVTFCSPGMGSVPFGFGLVTKVLLRFVHDHARLIFQTAKTS